MRILTAAAMREVDRMAIEEIGIPSMVLMENAAIGVADAVADGFPDVESVAIFCGPGNNGGDGLAVGRHLVARGYRVSLFLADSGRPPAGDAARQLEICRNAGLEVTAIEGAGLAACLTAAGRADLTIDALFGTGLTRPLTGELAALVAGLNDLSSPCLAVDLPSGLDASRAATIGPHIEADLTVAFAAPKVAHVFAPAAAAVGEVVVADLGIPPGLVSGAEGDLWLSEAAELAPLLPARPAAAHKGDFGHLLVVGGSTGKSGAAVLAARAALRCGTGLVTAAVPEPVVSILETASIETMTTPLPVAGDGGLSEAAVGAVEAALSGKTAWVAGPGLGDAASTGDAIRRAVVALPLPLVLDADGLNAFAGGLETLARREAETVLTPHVGELARLLGVDNSEVVSERLGSARRAAEISAAIVVLKGRRTLVVDPRGGIFVNPTGNPGMATAGTGDVLTGLIGGFLAQALDALAAARLGVFVHGLAGDLAAADLGEAALTAGDVLGAVPAAIEELAASF